MYIYYIYNIKVNSDFKLPGMEEEEIKGICIDKEIFINGYSKRAFFPKLSDSNKKSRDDTEIYFEEEYLVMRYKKQWEMSILRTGEGIYIKEECEDIGQAFSILLGTGLSILLLMNGYIPIHAGAFEYNKKAIIVVGKSGVGKSSFIRFAIQQGYKMITEDTLPLKVKRNKLLGYPSISIKSKLTDKSIKYYNIPQIYIGEQLNKTKKYWISVPKCNRFNNSIEVKRVFFLEPSSGHKGIQISHLKIDEKEKNILKAVNSLNDIPIDNVKKILKNIFEIIEHIEAYVVRYPIGLEHFQDLMDKLVNFEENVK